MKKRLGDLKKTAIFAFLHYFCFMFTRDSLDSIEMLPMDRKSDGWTLLSGTCLPIPVRSAAHAVVMDRIFLIGNFVFIFL